MTANKQTVAGGMNRSRYLAGVALGVMVTAVASLVMSPKSAVAHDPPDIVRVRPLPLPITSTDDGARDVVSHNVSVNFGNGSGTCNSASPIDVPAGKRLVIEHISAQALLATPSALVSVRLVDRANTEHTVVYAAANPSHFVQTISATYNLAVVSQDMHVYADAPMQVCAASTFANRDAVSVVVSGYLVNRTP
jgi:hypothetical protein